ERAPVGRNRSAGVRRRTHRPRSAVTARDPVPDRGAFRPPASPPLPRRLRPAQPPAERLPPFLHDRLARCDRDPGPAPAEGPDPPGRERLPLPAPRRGPSRAGLRQRRLPDTPVQPVRLLRGRTDPRVTVATTDEAADYADALRALEERGRFGIHLGLSRVRALLRALGDPQLGVRGALVAGTNGKGSTLALVAAALREAGLRAGAQPKPHLVTYRERMQIGGVPVSPSTFAGLVSRALTAADRVPRRLGPPTEF